MKLEFLMEYHVDLKPPVQIGRGPLGTRTIFDVVGGHAKGPRVAGNFLASGADWILIDDAGIGRLDVRGTLVTDDGAHIYVQYNGILEMNAKVLGALTRGEATDYGDTYFMNQPRFETGDERYAWLTRLVTVGEGRVLPNAVEYRVHAVVNG